MRKPKKYHYIYKITRNDGKYYIGLHSTDNLEDGYFGSGKRLWYSIKKHGKDAHTKEIIEFLPSREDLKKREAELVNEECVADPMCINIRLGGEGGWDHVNGNRLYDEQRSISRRKGWAKSKEKFNDELYKSYFKEKCKRSARKRLEDGKNRPFTTDERLKGCENAQSIEAKIKRKETMAKNGHSQGEKNSQFGKMWITNGIESMKIKKDEPIPDGWKRGRASRQLATATAWKAVEV